MHKKLLFIMGIAFLFVLSVLLFAFATLRKTSSQPSVQAPTHILQPSKYPTPTTSSTIRVLSTKPATGAQNIAVDISAVRILFSTPQNPEQFIVYLGAKNTKIAVGTNVTAEGNQLIIQPLMTLIPDSVYTLTIKSVVGNSFTYSLSFTTAHIPVVDTFPSGFDTYTEQRDLNERPDIYLANKLPYGTDSFLMTLEVPDSGAYIYHVKSKIADVQKVKTDVAVWLQSIGITSAESSGFDIRYE